MQPEILDALYRLIGEYGWNWGMARNLINRQFGTNYDQRTAAVLYAPPAAKT
ncbi:MAG: hypothetical protein ACLUNO_05535 [Oscillospiraceae bacterium]